MTERDKWDKRLRRVYQITAANYERQLAVQGGVCYLCGRPPTKKRLSVEHRHSDGLLRGLVCSGPRSCNNAIAAVENSHCDASRLMAYLDACKWLPIRFTLPGRCTTNLKRRRKLAMMRDAK